MQLRDNVVRLQAKWADGTIQDGFGFIVGERGGMALIATANHVVRSEGRVAERVTLWYYQGKGRGVDTDVLETGDPDLDLAALEAPLPDYVTWRQGVVSSTEAGRGTKVWFIGRTGDWDVPAEPGTINKVNPNRHEIEVEGLNVMVGSSGAPLVAESGIVGMIVEDDPVSVVMARPINAIKYAFVEWNLPWELGSGSVPDTAASERPSPQAAAPTHADMGTLCVTLTTSVLGKPVTASSGAGTYQVPSGRCQDLPIGSYILSTVSENCAQANVSIRKDATSTIALGCRAPLAE